jgi:signal transduction histidine kinase
VLGNTKEAEKIAREAFTIYQSIPFARRYVSVYNVLSRTFVLTNNYDLAYRVEDEEHALKDSIYEWRKIWAIEDLQAKYDAEMTKRAMEVLSKEKLEQQLETVQFRTALFFTVIIMLGLLVAALVYQRKREKYLKRIKILETNQKIREEKERIKQELHDSLGSQLSSISLGLNRAIQHENQNSLIGIQEIADKAINELRDSLWVLDQTEISIEELVQRIQTIFWQYRRIDVPIEMELKTNGNLSQSLTAVMAGNLFRIAQEAIQNAIKHSDAKKIIITLTISDDLLNLSISDDGRGFNWPTSEATDHYGLNNIKKRAAQLQAQLLINSMLNKGTSVSLELNIKNSVPYKIS